MASSSCTHILFAPFFCYPFLILTKRSFSLVSKSGVFFHSILPTGMCGTLQSGETAAWKQCWRVMRGYSLGMIRNFVVVGSTSEMSSAPCIMTLVRLINSYINFGEWVIFVWHTKCGPENKRCPHCVGTWNTVWTYPFPQCFHKLHIFSFLKKEAFWYVVICLKMEENIKRKDWDEIRPKKKVQWKWQWFYEFYFTIECPHSVCKTRLCGGMGNDEPWPSLCFNSVGWLAGFLVFWLSGFK